MSKYLFSWVLLLSLIASPVWAQEVYDFSSGPSSWGTTDGSGLIGISAEIEQQDFALEVFLGIGTNRVQGWGLGPRMYLTGTEEVWRPFGEFSLIQISETEISIDPEVGLIKNTFTWQFMGVGLGTSYQQNGRMMRASIGLGVNGGQCLHCQMHAYASLHIGFAFEPFSIDL